MAKYEEWKQTNDGHGWKIKYYKGLGTSSPHEAREYFANLASHVVEFEWSGENDGKLIQMAFTKAAPSPSEGKKPEKKKGKTKKGAQQQQQRKAANDRRDWINSYQVCCQPALLSFVG